MEHEHVYGPVEHARFTGNPHRKCMVEGCNVVSLDLDELDDDRPCPCGVAHTAAEHTYDPDNEED